ncbi:unnamed protein product [Psylliodes chrysocephalus]|uniref:Major facilitator superfamily (MFS) profile domain-containing protein n=1 Tax=Psylliodes chrysocephalus TaxID=3402493 RepID=A0A9P0CJ97_9CUCU|nr:unnamed protein product [Psylliodes chrysocephala]
MPSASTDLIKKERRIDVKVYKRRWAILSIFILYGLGNSFQWVEYSIVTNVVVKYYNVSSLAVDWSAIIYLCIYPVIFIPASYIIDTQGLRTTALIGGIGTALGAILKLFSIRQDLFYVVLLGQSLGSAAQVFILCLPPKIAAVWFKPSEVSLANSLGVFGTQLGFGLGFLVPSMTIHDSDDLNSIGADFRKLCWMLAIYMVPVAAAIVFYFPDSPPLPPSKAQIECRKLQKPTFKEFCLGFVKIVKKPGMILQTMAYGINVGTYACFTTFLNQFILQYFEEGQKDAGTMGLLSVGIGMIGTILFGIFLDKTHKYKETNLVVCYMTAISMLAMAGALKMQNMILTYISCMSVGFFINSYWATGIELGVELTFPSDESTTTGILSAMSQAIGFVVCFAMGPFNQKYGGFWSMITLTVLFVIGALLTQAVPNIKKRQEEFQKNRKEEVVLVTPKV